MHELPITRSLLDLALHHAENAGGGRVTALDLEVGRLSGVIDRFVQFYWDIIAEGTPAEGATLRFTPVEIAMECGGCNNRFAPDGRVYDCPACGSSEVRVVDGDQFNLVSIDLEEEDRSGSKGRGT
jgi:hydrogenase nickel incorporation protein HypA/HybF